MPETNLPTLLKRVGMSTFVKYFRNFESLHNGRITDQDMIKILLPEKYTLKSRRSRTTKAKRIFRENLSKKALQLIAKSERTDDKTVKEAHRLLSKI